MCEAKFVAKLGAGYMLVVATYLKCQNYENSWFAGITFWGSKTSVYVLQFHIWKSLFTREVKCKNQKVKSNKGLRRVDALKKYVAILYNNCT